MKYTTTALGVSLAASMAFATAAHAQREGYGTRQPVQQTPQPRGQQQPAAKGKPTATITIGDRTVKASVEFIKAWQELTAAITANDAANIPGKLAAAQALAKSPEERYLVAEQQLKVASASKNESAMGAAMEALLATGLLPQGDAARLQLNLGKVYFNQKQYDRAIAAFQKALQFNPSNTEAASLIERARQLQSGGTAAADPVSELAKYKASGQKPPEPLYKRAVAAAYEAKRPNAVELSREWVSAYPTPANWSDALRIYRSLNNLDESATLDVLRLARAVNALKGEADFHRYAYATITRGYPGEAKAVLEEGFAANAIDRNKSLFKTAIAEATTKSAGERARLDELVKIALSAPTAKQAAATGDLLYGYGDYAKAAELYRAALGKTGADESLLNLHLGMALARAGDKGGATAALNAVTGARSDLAKYWLVYLATRS